MSDTKRNGNIWQLSFKMKGCEKQWFNCHGDYESLSEIVDSWMAYKNQRDQSSSQMIMVKTVDDDVCRTEFEMPVDMRDILLLQLRHCYGPDSSGIRWWQLGGMMDCGVEFAYKFEHKEEADAILDAWKDHKTHGTDMSSIHEFECVSDSYDRSIMRRMIDLSRIVTAHVTNTN